MRTHRSIAPIAIASIGLFIVMSCSRPAKQSSERSSGTTGAVGTGGTARAQARLQPNPDREAYFGEEHIHTSWSVDAWVFGNHLTGPGDAYKYAQGQTIKHPLGYDITIDTPLDFMGVTDHSEYVGVTKQANTPGSPVSKIPAAQELILKEPVTKEETQRVYLYLIKLLAGPVVPSLASKEVASTVWKDNVRIADENNHPGKFTAFCSYEWTSMPNNRNLHRNVFFRDCARVPDMPYSALQSTHPEDLWNWMDAQRKAGNELLAISHNANLSDGWMYPIDVDSFGRPIDAAWAESRMRNERLIEMKQIKGQSETHPLLSPNDEFANYEINSFLLGLPADSGRLNRIAGSYARQALKDGITMQDVRGYNPYKFGMAGGSDSHNTGAPYRQNNFYGGHAMEDGTVQTRMAGHVFGGVDARYINPGGLTGVWAEENTRASLWDAMYRKETFGVSGPRIKVRFFGGWGYDSTVFDDPNWIHLAYTNGVPMGADLPPMKGKAPSFVLWAVKDPTSGNLDRIQIIKGWTKNGQSFEKIFDVAWAGNRKPDKWTGAIPAITSTVDLNNATYTNTVGVVQLQTVWTDPEFDPSLHAFYYARVLEIPTPRWTTIQAHQLGIAPPDVVPATVQERAWTSPIWYTPTTDARQNAKAGVTVADLTKQGAKPLTTDQLKTLLVGKAVWVRNTVTGEQFKVSYSADGQSVIWHVGAGATPSSGAGNVAQNAYLGTASHYQIENGKVMTMLSDAPYAETVYKTGDSYRIARGNEFGYANYEIMAKPPDFLHPLGKGETPDQSQANYLHAKE